MAKKIKSILLLVLLISIITINNINAEELNQIYYTNSNNVKLSKEEYNFLSKFYWDGYQENMTLKDYQEFIDSDIINGEFKSVEKMYYENSGITLYNTSHQTNSKLIKISSSCNTTCTISVTVTWSTIPNTKSYDVIGAYLENVNLLKSPITKSQSSSSIIESSEIKKPSNGFGVSIKLPTEGKSYMITQTYTVSKGGTVYASYQHAKKNISLADSKNYTISRDGYGGVFKFTGTAVNVYDQMGGVSITV